MTYPLISIIIATFNSEQTLGKAISSVARQTYRHRELIIVDGGSRDGTVSLLKSRESEITRWISESDDGVYDAFNKGIALSRGDWILFLGSDDELDSFDVVENAAVRLSELPDSVRVAYGKVAVRGPDGRILRIVGDPWERASGAFQRTMSIPHQATFHRRSFFEAHGLFDRSYRIVGDYELLLRELKSGVAVHFSDLLVAKMSVGGLSSNPAHAGRMLDEKMRARRKHGLGIGVLRSWIVDFRLRFEVLLANRIGPRWTARVLSLLRRIIAWKRSLNA